MRDDASEVDLEEEADGFGMMCEQDPWVALAVALLFGLIAIPGLPGLAWEALHKKWPPAQQ